MSVFEAIVLGIVQGVTEFLPISSTAHLRIVPAFAGWEDPGAAFTAVTQLGTMAAVLLYFRADLWRIAQRLDALPARPRRSPRAATPGWAGTSCWAPSRLAIFGLAFKDQIETGARDLYMIGTALIVLGLVLLLAEKVGKRERSIEQITTRDGVALGFAQALALVPGVSRSGATITAGLFLGLDRESAARFSFLLSMPAVVLSGLLELGSIASGEEGENVGTGALVIATFFAFVAATRRSPSCCASWPPTPPMVFVVYRVVLGTLVLVLVSAGDDRLVRSS